MKTVIFATSNKDKMKEIREILSGLDVEVKTMREAGFSEEIEENGITFEENAGIKASAVASYLEQTSYAGDYIVLADDSGLEIDAMDKMPGVQSHRWLGERTYTQAMLDIIEELKDVPEEKRTARFVCAIAAYIPGQGLKTVQRACEGVVAHELAGEEGFGYDPFFYMPEYGCTTAQMTRAQKNSVSHRGKALTAMKEMLLENGILTSV